MTEQKVEQPGVFATGPKNDAYAQYFIGQSYNNTLVTPGEDVSVPVGNVTFEPGCRNNWHIHHHGSQILLVTGGEGWYQEEGKAAQLLRSEERRVGKERRSMCWQDRHKEREKE